MRLEIPDFELVQADKRRNTAEKTLTLADLRAPHRRALLLGNLGIERCP